MFVNLFIFSVGCAPDMSEVVLVGRGRFIEWRGGLGIEEGPIDWRDIVWDRERGREELVWGEKVEVMR